MIASAKRLQRASGRALAVLILMIHISVTDANAAERRRFCLLELGAFGLSGGVLCEQAPQASPVVVDTSCQAFKPIRYSRKDTPETAQQVREHNAAFDALCRHGPAGNK
jgi:hypothetical protein